MANAKTLTGHKQQKPRLSKARNKFWTLLQDSKNHTISVSELCKKAGYRSATMWYAVIDDEEFRAQVESLGIVVVEHQLDPPDGVIPLAEDPEEEWAKDIIDIRRLTMDYPRHYSVTDLKLDFSIIPNPALKAVVKRYFRAQLGFLEPGTLAVYLRWVKPFFIELEKRYPTLASFRDLNREMIEPLLSQSSWVDAWGRNHVITPSRKVMIITPLASMFKYMQLHNWEDAPIGTLIFEEDRPKRPRLVPRPIPQTVLDQLKENITLLPPYARNLIGILMVTGLRSEDALHLVEDCIEFDSAGDPRLRWYNHKMKREGRPLPVTMDVVEVVRRQQALVKDIPDHFGKHYLFRTEQGLYKVYTFRRDLGFYIEQANIRGIDGKLYPLTPHQFRHTVGTEMINNGSGIADVMAYLDHSSPEMSLRYALIEDETLKEKFKQRVLSKQFVGGKALETLREQLEQGDETELDWIVQNLRRNSLPWGHCLHHSKAPKCPYGQNVCFTVNNGPCHKLVTTPDHAPIILATKEDLEKSLGVAQEKGWDMYANDLKDQINGMQQVLDELDLPKDQRSKNRGGNRGEESDEL